MAAEHRFSIQNQMMMSDMKSCLLEQIAFNDQRHQFKFIKALSTYQFSCHSVGKKHLASLSIVGMKGGCRVSIFVHLFISMPFIHLFSST